MLKDERVDVTAYYLENDVEMRMIKPKGSDAKVFLIDYRLAPKYQYPIAPDDCFMGFEFLYHNKDKLDIDIENIVIGGDSAGGYLAVTTTLKMYEKYGFVPKGNFLIYPAASKDTESVRKYTDTPLCNSRDAEMYDGWFNNGEMVVFLMRSILRGWG